MKAIEFGFKLGNIISPKTIIDRFEDLEDELLELEEEIEDIQKEYDEEHDYSVSDKIKESLDLAKKKWTEWMEENNDEYQELDRIIKEGESYSDDWYYETSLISESYFTDYVKELINSCYDLPDEMAYGAWPFNHIKLDYEGAAEELKQDYIEITIGGKSYYIR